MGRIVALSGLSFRETLDEAWNHDHVYLETVTADYDREP
jgi:hypothetical protein